MLKIDRFFILYLIVLLLIVLIIIFLNHEKTLFVFLASVVFVSDD